MCDQHGKSNLIAGGQSDFATDYEESPRDPHREAESIEAWKIRLGSMWRLRSLRQSQQRSLRFLRSATHAR
jgi:hypothetical protein